LVVIFLEVAELRVKNRNDITMSFWMDNVDQILRFNDRAVLLHKGAISSTSMEKKVKQIYERFDTKRKAFEAKQADLQDIEELENKIKKKK